MKRNYLIQFADPDSEEIDPDRWLVVRAESQRGALLVGIQQTFTTETLPERLVCYLALGPDRFRNGAPVFVRRWFMDTISGGESITETILQLPAPDGAE